MLNWNEVLDDWKTHLTRRVSVPTEAPPLDGVTAGGWKLGYTDKPSALFEAHEASAKAAHLLPSIGLTVKDEKVGDVAPGMKIVAVNGRKFTPTG